MDFCFQMLYIAQPFWQCPWDYIHFFWSCKLIKLNQWKATNDMFCFSFYCSSMLILHLEFESHGSWLFKRAIGHGLNTHNTVKLLTTAIKEKRKKGSCTILPHAHIYRDGMSALFQSFFFFFLNSYVKFLFSSSSAEISFPETLFNLFLKRWKLCVCVCACHWTPGLRKLKWWYQLMKTYM